MNPMEVEDGKFYWHDGETYECQHGMYGFNMYEKDDDVPTCEINKYMCGVWQGIRPATSDEIKAYKQASPRYKNYGAPKFTGNRDEDGDPYIPSPDMQICDPDKSKSPKPRRKVVQFYPGIPCAALCDDGTMWELPHNATEWTRIPDIPQE